MPTHRKLVAIGSSGLHKMGCTVEAEPAIAVDVGVEDLGLEGYVGGFGGVGFAEL